MKIIYKYNIILLVLFLVVSCAVEPYVEVSPDFKLSFQRDGRTTALAGVSFYVIPTVDAEFLTLYDGSKGHVWGESGATGTDFNTLDSLGVRYDSIGQYNLSLVATSIGDLGQKITKLSKTITVNVVDERNSILKFAMNNMYGVISDNQILFSMPDVISSFKFKPFFELASNSVACTVTVNGTTQISGVSEQVFTPNVPVVYTVTSPSGAPKTYSVIVSTYKSSSEAKLSKFNLSSGVGTNGFGEVGIINDANKTVTLNLNYATDLSSVKVVAQSSYASTLKLRTAPGTALKTYSSTVFYSLTNSSQAVVTAEDKVTVGTYSFNLVVGDPVTDFTFAGFYPAPIKVIDTAAKTITIELAKGTDVTKLKAQWTGSLGVVSVKNGTSEVVQTNGETVNDFTLPQQYTFYKGNTSTTDLSKLVSGDVYTVSIKFK